MPEILRFEDVNYVKNGNSILKHCNFALSEGESLAILGRNGAGKTTLINLLYGYFWPSSGKVFVFGEEYGTTPLRPLQSKIGILQSNHQDQLIQRSLTAIEVIITGLHKNLGLYKEISETDRTLALHLLSSMQMSEKADQNFTTLSSGEKTKVLLLRAIGSGIQLLVLDEPTAALDFTARHYFEQGIRQIKLGNPHLTRILITHRLEEIPEDFQKVMLLKEGEIIAIGNKEEVLTNQNLSNLYELSLEVKKIGQRFIISDLGETKEP